MAQREGGALLVHIGWWYTLNRLYGFFLRVEPDTRQGIRHTHIYISSIMPKAIEQVWW
jgi:hypothetical protein